MNTIKYTSAVSIDKGLIRNNNEDNFYFNGTYLYVDERDISNTFSSTPSNEMQIYGVFDGMGGEALGEEASLITAQVMDKTHKRIVASNCDFEKEILSSIENANTKICKKIVESGEKRIGATFSTLVIEDDKAMVFNVGDSRVYLLREGMLEQISVDDTTTQRLVSMGVLTPEKAKTHKDRHKLTQHLGIFKDEMIIEPHVSKKIDIKAGDKFLLCSDGLTDMLTDEEIYKILSQNKTCEELSKELVKAALKNGGKDNVTAIIIKAETGKKKKVLPFKKFIMPISLLIIVSVGYGVFSALQKDTVEKQNREEVAQPTNIYFSNPISEIKLGAEDTFMVGIEPANTKTKVSFSSSNSDVIEIDEETGFYKAVSAGKTIIKATTSELSCEIEIEVYKPVEDILDIPKKLVLNIETSRKIQYNILPEDVKERAVFTSDNENVATVTRDGIVEARSVGDANITISIKDYSETIEVNVTDGKSNRSNEAGTTNSNNDTVKVPSKTENQGEPKKTESIKPSKENPKAEGNNEVRETLDTEREIVQDDNKKENQ